MKNSTSRQLTRAALLAVFMCALPALAGEDFFGLGNGHNGPLNVGSGNNIVNVYANLSAPAAPGDTSLSFSSATGSIGAGDLIMVLQTTGIVPEPASGTAGPIDLSNDPVGRWELARVASVSGATLSMPRPLLYSYAANVTQIIKVPEYTDVTVSGTASLVARSWNGTLGGVVAFLATGTVTLNTSITATGKGFRGGQPVNDTSGSTGCSGLDDPLQEGAQKGEGIAVTRYGASQTGRGHVANGAGGGVCQNAGGGGGGNGGTGGQGGNSDLALDGNRAVGGQGGTALTFDLLDHLVMGGGGGAGHEVNGTGAAGGAGGGIIFIRANAMAGVGQMMANGSPGGNSTGQDAAGGGGGGGSLYLRVTGVSACGSLQALGGNGGLAISGFDVGPGGSGGGGRILFQKGSGTCAPTAASVNSGNPGVQADSSAPGGASYGAQPGTAGITTTLTGGFFPMVAPVVVTPPNGSSTNNKLSVYSGTLALPIPVGTQVAVYVDGVEVGRVTPDASGNWTFTQPTGLAEGAHSVHAIAINTSQGLQSGSSNTNNFTVDMTLPAAPVMVAPVNGSTTSNNKPTYSGTAEVGSTVTVSVDGTVVGTTTANASGSWNFTPTTALADGMRTVNARATDAAGNTGPDSNTNTFTVDTQPPAAPVVSAPANGSTTGDNTPTYSGTAEAETTVTIIVDGTEVGTTTADASETWNFTPTTSLADGVHTVTARATDAVGHTSPDSDINSFTVDTVPPPAPVVLTPANGSLVTTAKPVISGTAEANSTVSVFLDGTEAGTAVADGLGNWSFTPSTALLQGAHSITAQATDAAGNTSPASNSLSFSVNTPTPTAPLVLMPANGAVVKTSTPVISGRADAGNTVTISLDETVVGTAPADDSGSWNFTPSTSLTQGHHTVTAQASNAAGNTSPVSNPSTLIVDTVGPDAPVVTSPPAGAVVDMRRPLVTGTAEVGSKVTVILDGTEMDTIALPGTDTWSFKPAEDLPLGSHTLAARGVDAIGNPGPASVPISFTITTRGQYGGCATAPGSAAGWVAGALGIGCLRRRRRGQRIQSPWTVGKLAMVLLCLGSLLSGEAFGRVPKVRTPYPSGRNPYFKEVAQGYDSLHFERALEAAQKARAESNNSPQELLWLDLMEGVLQYELEHEGAAAEAFTHALARNREAQLPVPTPSARLLEIFDSVHKRSQEPPPIDPVPMSAPPQAETAHSPVEPQPPVTVAKESSPAAQSAQAASSPAEPRPPVAVAEDSGGLAKSPPEPPAPDVHREPAREPTALGFMIGVRSEAEVLKRGMLPSLTAEFSGGSDASLSEMQLGAALTALFLSTGVRAEGRLYPYDLGSPGEWRVRPYLALGATYFLNPERVGGRGGVGAALQLGSLQLFGDVAYERFFTQSGTSAYYYEPNALLVSLGVGWSPFSRR